MQDSEPVVATPKLGLAKGIIIILMGVAGSGAMLVVAGVVGFLATVEPWYGISDERVAMIAVAFLLPPIIFGLCLWRGIVAIHKRKVKRVTYLNFSLWVSPAFLALAVWHWSELAVELISAWALAVVIVVAVALVIYLKRRKARSKTSAQETPLTQDSEQVEATPRLGLAKGIIAILLGVTAGVVVAFVALLGNAVLFAMANNPWYDYHGREAWTNYAILITGVVIGSVIFGLCLWRGIVAIRKRKFRRVTHFNFGLWLGFFVVAGLPVVVVATMILAEPDSPSALLSQWWVWVTVAVVAVAVGIGVWLKRRRVQSS